MVPELLEPFETPVNCLRFFELQTAVGAIVEGESMMVDHPALTWNQIAAFLRQFDRLRPAA